MHERTVLAVPRGCDGVAQLVVHWTRDPTKDPRFKPRQDKFVRVFRSQKSCGDSLSVCPIPVCIHTHKNDHVCMLILQSSVDYGKSLNVPACTYRTG